MGILRWRRGRREERRMFARGGASYAEVVHHLDVHALEERCKTRRRLVCRNFRAFSPYIRRCNFRSWDPVTERSPGRYNRSEIRYFNERKRERERGRKKSYAEATCFEDRYLVKRLYRENGSLDYSWFSCKNLIKKWKGEVRLDYDTYHIPQDTFLHEADI